MTEIEKTCRVKAQQAGMTVEAFLRKETGLAKAQVRSLKFRENGICVNGERARVTRMLQEGDVLRLSLPVRSGTDAACPCPAWVADAILYEDTDVLCVDKPAGLVTHPSHGHHGDTLLDVAERYLAARGEAVRLHAIGRLDADTCGIVVFAKHPFAAAALWKQKEEGVFKKEYLALCEGDGNGWQVGETRTIRTPLQKDARYLNRMKTAGEDACTPALPAETVCTCIAREGERLLFRVQIATGRTHQIRVHLSSIGVPLAGDAVYGNGTKGETQAALCAFSLRFVSTVTGENVELLSKHEFFLKDY